MSATARVGAAMAAGYVLGRFKKLRLALIVGSALANKNVRASGLGLLQRGTKGFAGSPDALRISDQIKSRLIESGRAAAVGVAASQIDKFSDRLRDRSSSIRPGRQDEEPEDEYEESEDEYEEAEAEEPEDEYDEAEAEEAEAEEPEDEYEEAEAEEPEDEYEEAEAEEPEEPAEEKPRPHRRSSRRRRAAAPVES